MPLDLTVSLTDATSLRQAARELRAYRRRFEEKQKLFLEKLATIGIHVMTAQFSQALAGYSGRQTMPQLNVQIEGNTATLTAAGETVAFLEFGAGVSHPEHSSGLYQHGTYGKGYGNRRVWGFYPGGDKTQAAVLTTGNDPAEAMPEAVRRMAELCSDTAREVFGHD